MARAQSPDRTTVEAVGVVDPQSDTLDRDDGSYLDPSWRPT